MVIARTAKLVAKTRPENNAPRRAEKEDLLPWADPYIASLIREHETQCRRESRRSASR
jgi:hypothetical protein